MANINHVILEYADIISQTGILADTTPQKAVIRRFVRVFSSVEDRRIDSMTDYPLIEIHFVTFLAVLANASTWTEIVQFGEEKKRWLRKFLPLKHGIPSHQHLPAGILPY